MLSTWCLFAERRTGKEVSGEIRKEFLKEMEQTNLDPATGGFWSLK